MEFRVLGSLEVLVEGRPLALGAAKQRLLLAVLVLNDNRVVSTDRLIDALWGDQAPDGAAHTVQVYVSQLRKVLRVPGSPAPETVLVTQGRGYVLRVQPDAIDLHRFERTVGEGRRALAAGDLARAADVLRGALTLWRGSPLEEFAHEAFVQPDIARIEDLWLSAVEDRIEADLGLGAHVELVGELRPLIAEHPLRERLRRHLMLALYRSGRQAEALQVYQDTRRLLADELGIDPSPDLQRLERAILEQDPALDRLPPSAAGSELAEPVPVVPPPKKRRGLLVGVGVFALAVGLVVSIAMLTRGGSGTPHPSSVQPNGVGRIDPAAVDLVAAIPTTGTAPGPLVWADGSLWVANIISRTVARIDPETDRVVQTVPTGGAPTDLATGDGVVWVLNGLEGTVLAIDPRTNEVSTSTDVPVGAGGIAFGAEAVWVTDSLRGGLTKIDPQSREVVETIQLGDPETVSPDAIAAEGNSLWIGDRLNPVLLQVDAATGDVSTAGLRDVVSGIAIGEAGTVWVTSYGSDLISIVDVETLQATTILVGAGPTGIAADADGVWVAESLDGAVSLVDPISKDVIRTIGVGAITEDLALGGGSVWVSVHA